MRSLVICLLSIVTVYAQFDGPAPPRLQIPGAVPVGGPPRGGFRQGRLQAAPVQGPTVARIRRPGLSRPSFKSVDPPRPNLQLLDEPAKPVTEEPEDDIEINTPTAYAPNYSTQDSQNDFFDFTTTSQPKPPSAYNSYPQTTPSPPKPEPIRPTQYRPLLPQSFSPIRNEVSARPQPARIQPLSSRPQRPSFRPEPKPFVDDEEDYPAQPVRQRPQEPARAPAKNTAPQRYVPSHNREKKPVAQIIRKYREENEDGTIVWGFENDDGSFKEETIGVDCTVRGKYGYIDPDGVKREYNYETGIVCDKTKETPEQKGYVDYQENKAVLPNGITIDLAAMGKNKSKRPFRAASHQ
ncbi:vegetative cell wall protein gp1 [Aricia agestis]|uniref:vegetative cell wall protein gp1 n=1 Tax=Aricia agestis TaxID=91739 RepID=UPI001C2049A2|nr:vegetative cell wall protein gp1 [Aricia agestis]